MGEAKSWHRGHSGIVSDPWFLVCFTVYFPEDTNLELVKGEAARPEGGTRRGKKLTVY